MKKRRAVKISLLLCLIPLAVGLCWSCSPKIIEKVVTEYRDTTIVKETTRDSLIYVPIPLEKDQVIVHAGDTSRVETSLARSEAYVGRDGLLHHGIQNKSEKTLPVLVPVKGTYIYTGVTNNLAESLNRIEYRDKPLTWWQKFRMKAFWWLLAGLVLSLGWIFRKPILAILKKWLPV